MLQQICFFTSVNQLRSKVPTIRVNTQQTWCAHTDRTDRECEWGGEGREAGLLQHTSVRMHAANHQGFGGGICGEGIARTDPSFPHHACDSALFTLSWRVALFDQAGEARGWVVVLTKSQCAVCWQGNFPGWLWVLTCMGRGRMGCGDGEGDESNT